MFAISSMSSERTANGRSLLPAFFGLARVDSWNFASFRHKRIAMQSGKWLCNGIAYFCADGCSRSNLVDACFQQFFFLGMQTAIVLWKLADPLGICVWLTRLAFAFIELPTAIGRAFFCRPTWG